MQEANDDLSSETYQEGVTPVQSFTCSSCGLEEIWTRLPK